MGNKKERFSEYDEIHKDFTTRTFEGHLSVPSNFRMLCALFETSPAKILSDFMWTLSCMHQGTDEQRKAALDYFILSGHGQEIYSEEDVRQIFRELDARRSMYPGGEDRVMSKEQWNLYYCWENMYTQYWFEKWYGKIRRRSEGNPMENY